MSHISHRTSKNSQTGKTHKTTQFGNQHHLPHKSWHLVARFGA